MIMSKFGQSRPTITTSTNRQQVISIITVLILLIYSVKSVTSRKSKYEETTAASLKRAFFSNYLSFITMACIWLFLLIVLILFRMYKIDERNKLRQVFDDCSQSTSQFKYLVRVRVGVASENFQKDTSAIMMDLLDVKDRFITRLSISPSWLRQDVFSKQESKTKLRTLKFVLNRATPMPAIGAIRLSHDSYFPVGGYIFLHSVDIRNLRENLLTSIPILKRIFVLPPDAGEFDQVYKAKPATSAGVYDIDDTHIGGYSPYINTPEAIIFIFLYSNLALLTTMFKPNYMKITNLEAAVSNGVVGFGSAFGATFIILLFYRYVIKILYSKNRATGPWAAIRVIFLTSLIINAMVIGLVASLIQTRNNGTVLSFWSLANVFSNAILFAGLVPTIILFIFWDRRLRKNIEESRTVTLLNPIIDEAKPPEERLRIGESRVTNKAKDKGEIGKFETSRATRTGEDDYALKTLARKKKSIEEGLIDVEADPLFSPRKVRDRILHRINSVLGRSSKEEPKSTGEEKIFAIDKRLEDKSANLD